MGYFLVRCERTFALNIKCYYKYALKDFCPYDLEKETANRIGWPGEFISRKLTNNLLKY